MKLSTENIKRKNPINRNNFFTSPDQINFQIAMGMEYVNKILNQTVVLYEVDRSKTKSDDIYNEANYKDLVFKTPVELNVMYKLDKPELKTYDEQKIKGYYVKVGQFTFTIYNKELEENGCDINRGDYIGLQVTPDMVIPDRDAEGASLLELPEDLLRTTTGLVCNCDYTACVLLNRLNALGIRVPQDLSIVSYDNDIRSEMSSVGITTYAVDLDGMAEASAEQIRRRIRFPDARRQIVTVSGEIIARESDAPPAD